MTSVQADLKCQCCPHIETSQLNCTANQLNGFYISATLALNGLKRKLRYWFLKQSSTSFNLIQLSLQSSPLPPLIENFVHDITFTTALQKILKKGRIGSSSCSHFPAFGLNTGICSVNLRIQSKSGKIKTRKTPNMDTFYAVKNLQIKSYSY